MPNFRATVRFLDLVGPDVLAVRKALEDRLQQSGAGKWRVVDVAPEKGARRQGATVRWRTDRDIAAKLMLTGAAMWALWFFWTLVD
ncbi:MAG: hypothetical protein HY699_18340 [Deltaproteobacteria bacterium]|nr:hypothetical protein [Deltaproteobacteria bacterium]